MAERQQPEDDITDIVRICPVTGTYCTGEFCEDYGCAKEVGFYDDEDDHG